ncbi:MAG TPA: polyphosphate kinase 1 [Bacteroidales bacterium]|nr:polyphosphate kinase 1 [Bacteroidales bacterium]
MTFSKVKNQEPMNISDNFIEDDLFINREISWLQFNERVLQEASDPTTPLLERIKFLGIFSNNRDEFFRVRVATIHRMNMLMQKKELDYRINFDPKKLLSEIYSIVEDQEKRFTAVYQDLTRQLKENGIFIVNEEELTKEQGEYVRSFFNQHIRSYVFPIMLNNVKDLTFLKDQNFYLAVVMADTTKKNKTRFALLKVPVQIVGRFIILDPPENNKNSHFIILLDDVIRYCLPDIFSVFGYNHFEAYTVKFTRDAELDIDNDVSKSFIERIEESLKQREKGVPVRFVYDEKMPLVLLDKLKQKMRINEKDTLRAGSRYHNFKDFMEFPKINNPAFYFEPFPPLAHPLLPPNHSILAVMRQQDIMLHYPYHSFQYLIDLLREASIDPQVKEIKMTFYRTARDSSVINSLINAARNGKKVTVFLELQARFEEETNIYWVNRLQEEAVEIIPTIPDYKVHAKLLVIKRIEEDGNELLYCNVSTGNFNESTATVYADDSLFTTDPRITKDVDKVFTLFKSRYIPPTFENLYVSPFNIRSFIIRQLNNEIRNVKEGKEAWAILKVNSLVDEEIANKIYEAAQSGVNIKLSVRGICVIKPGIPNLSNNIEALSIVDRFLEHSRVFIFCNSGRNKFFISSADLMPRNLDHRIEVVCPIFDKGIQKELMQMLQIELNANVKARTLDYGHINEYRSVNPTKKIRSQHEKYYMFRNMLKMNNTVEGNTKS